jgi:RHS repeat-associated protein
MRETIFVWDSVNDCVMSELDGSGAVQVTYTNEPQQYGGVISQRRGTTTSTYHADALGSTRALTDNSGAVTDTYLNDAWGNSVVSTGTTVNPFRWVGKYGYYTDNSTGQVYVRARMYQPTAARWCSVDPLAVRPRNMILYEYTFNSPTQLVDANGLDVTVNPNLAPSGDYQCGDQIKAGWTFSIQGGAPATGYIIQRVSIHCRISRCLWCEASAPLRPTYEFYEAWSANVGELGSASDFGEGSFIKNTCGTFNAIGEVRFFFTRDYTDPKTNRTYKGIGYLGESPNYGWERGLVHGAGLGCPTNTGDLRSSNQPPRTTATPPEILPGKPDWDNGMLLGRRTFSMDWKCCCGIKDEYATLNVGSSHD